MTRERAVSERQVRKKSSIDTLSMQIASQGGLQLYVTIPYLSKVAVEGFWESALVALSLLPAGRDLASQGGLRGTKCTNR